MSQRMLDGFSLELRPDGHLKSLDDWNIDVAQALAAQDGISLSDAHWEILDLMRRYYQTYNISPILKLLKKDIAESLGPDKAADDYLMSLFPRGVSNQGARIAGIPKPSLDAEIEQSSHIRQADSGKQSPPLFTEFTFEGKTYKVYARGNLVNPDDWNEDLAVYMANREDITLTDAHWEVLRFLRKFYFQYGITPMVRLLMKHMRNQMGEEKSSKDYLYRLFPGGPSRQGSRIAGLPEPQGCVDP